MVISSCGELPFVFEMSQTLMVILVEHSRKVGDLISVELFVFFLWKAERSGFRQIYSLLDFATECGLQGLLSNVKRKGEELVLVSSVTVVEMQRSELWFDTALWDCLGFYCFNLTGRIRCLSPFARQEKGWFN